MLRKQHKQAANKGGGNKGGGKQGGGKKRGGKNNINYFDLNFKMMKSNHPTGSSDYSRRDEPDLRRSSSQVEPNSNTASNQDL